MKLEKLKQKEEEKRIKEEQKNAEKVSNLLTDCGIIDCT